MCNECSLNKQRSRAAHGVDEVRVAFPSTHQNHAGSQHFIQRSFNGFLAVATTVKALTRRVEAERGIVFGDVDMQSQVGIGNRYIRTCARLLAELVNDGILHLVGYEFRVTELLGENHGVHSKCFLVVQILSPVDALYLLVNIIGALCLEMLDGLEDADSGMQLEISAIHHFLVAGERHHATTNFNVVCS